MRRQKWTVEMARTTRAIADREKHPVAVMWLVDTDTRITPHGVLPWFHGKSELRGTPRAAPRRKLTTARDIRIAGRGDWERLQEAVRSGGRVERVVVAPEDPELVRNAKFAEELAALAAEEGIVVELAGSILSHAYYVLRRRDVQVECVDLFGATVEEVDYNKLVRDRVPDAIERKGERVEVVRLRGDALMAALRQKLIEEAFEVLDAKGGQDLIGELADVQEVVLGICEALDVKRSAVERQRAGKRRRRGGFGGGVMLRKTAMPRTLTETASPEGGGGGSRLSGLGDEGPVGVVDVSTKHVYRRPDLRRIGELPEKVVLFEVPLHDVPKERQVTRFAMPGLASRSGDFALELEFSRTRGVLRRKFQ
ncbi:MAG: nucleoside triphosphate pyrophosphohydrolase [Acidobacteria bacterium]|nr:nucleoside triphosphate pyrophosphohydrolase [Acidobacteriota bacterium]